MKDNYCVIMGGGIGSRFWPFSRESYPKQFLDFWKRTVFTANDIDRFAKSSLLKYIHRYQRILCGLNQGAVAGISGRTNTFGTGSSQYGSLYRLCGLSY